MVLRRNTLDSGGEEGDPVTPASSAADGDAFTAVSAGVTYAAAAAGRGARGMTTTADPVGAWARVAFAGTKTLALQEIVQVTTSPTSDCHILAAGRGGSSFVRVASLHLNGTGRLRLSDAPSTSPGLWTATDPLDPTKKYLVKLLALVGTTTTNGTLAVAYRELGGPIIQTATVTTANLGTDDLTDATFGKRSSVPYVVRVDEPAWDTAAAALIGVQPTLSVTAAGGLCAVDARGSVAGDGSALSYAISPSAGVLEPVPGLFLVPQTAAAQPFTVTVTQSGTAYPLPVTVPAATGGGNPAYYTLTPGGWS
jgi:hypothetical protein